MIYLTFMEGTVYYLVTLSHRKILKTEDFALCDYLDILFVVLILTERKRGWSGISSYASATAR